MSKKSHTVLVHPKAKIPFDIYQGHLMADFKQSSIGTNKLIMPSSQKISLDAIADKDVYYVFCDFGKLNMDVSNLKFNKVYLDDKEIELRAWYCILDCYQKMQKLDVGFTKSIKDNIPKEIFYQLTNKKLTLANLCSLRNSNYNDYKNAIKKQKRTNKLQPIQPKNFAQLIEITNQK